MEDGQGAPFAEPPSVAASSRWHVLRTRGGRLALISALAVIVIVTGVVVTVSTRRDGADVPGPTAASATPSAAPTAALPPRQAEASDGGVLRIVEQEFNQLHESVELTLTPGHGPGDPAQYKPVRAAIIVENTSKDQVAIAPTFIARYLDPAGRGVVEYAAKSDENTLTTDAIFPGERVGIAAYFNNSDTTVARLTVRAVDAAWLSPVDARPWVSTITATNVKTIRSGSPKAMIVAFTAHSGYPDMVAAVANAIYRDSSGKIIGSSHIGALDRQYFPSGTADGSITVTDWLPANLDESRTQVYLTRAG